jgi:hypothetical protein
MKKLFVVIFILLAMASWASAEIYVKSKAHTDAISMMGQNRPAQDTFSEQWIGDDQFANITENLTTIIDLKKNIFYMINHKDKTYVETTLPLDMSKLLPPEMSAMAGMMKASITVTPTGQSKTIGQWNCSEYDVTMTMMMMPVKMKVLATTDVPFDVSKYMLKMYGNVLKAQMQLDDNAVQEVMKVKGFWIASDTTMEMMGQKMHTTTEVVEISKKGAPAGAYSVPAGYTKQDRLSMKQLQQK